MSVLVNKNTRLVVQGITGKAGSFHAEQCLEYGTNIVAGVTPGKGGQKFLSRVPIVDTVEQAVQKHGLPVYIRVDNGPEFISKDLDLWAYANKVTIDFSRPGKPTDNAYIESFNSRFRQECLNEHWFLNLEDAKLKILGWWGEYNSHRPHSSLGYKTPEEFANLEAISSC